MQTQRLELTRIGMQLKVKPEELSDRVEALWKECRQLRKELEGGRNTLDDNAIMSGLSKIGDIPLLAARLEDMPVKALRECMDRVRSRLPSGIACLGCAEDGKASLILYVSKDLHARFVAPDLIRKIGPAIGAAGGGGRPDLAQSGGPDPAGIEKAFALLRELLAGN